MTTINNIDELLKLEEDCRPLVLNKNDPEKKQEFILWRGANNANHELMTSLQVHLKDKLRSQNPNEWRTKIEDKEREFLNRFLDEIDPHKEALNKQYHWFKEMPGRQDTVWILSVMQHYGRLTRFVDFTACFWTAVFFAAEGANNSRDMLLYSLECKNADKNDEGGNKLPRDCNGNPWRNDAKKVCINDFLGQVIKYGDFSNSPKNLSTWKSPKQAFGWDRPRMKNARIEKQKGFFVYPVDVSQTLEEILKERAEFKKYKIKGTLLPEIREKLKEKELASWVVYLDLERAFKESKEDNV